MAKPHTPKKRGRSDGKNKKRKDTRIGLRKIRGPNGIKLKQAQYYRFPSTIRIYHYSASYLSLHTFKSLFRGRAHGYVAALLGSDDPLSRNLLTTATDIIPEGALEVGYLPSVFVHGGSALGFCVGNGVVEWLCFDRDIKESILDRLDINTKAQKMLFEHVADLEKPEGSGRKMEYTEHKDWWDSLRGAGRWPCVLRLGWRRFGWEVKAEDARLRGLDEEGGRGAEEEEEVENDEGEWEDQDEDWNRDEDGNEEEVFEGSDERETHSPEIVA